MVSDAYASECSGPYWSNPLFIIFWHSGQSVRMSKNEKGWLDQYGTELFGRFILPQSEKVWDSQNLHSRDLRSFEIRFQIELRIRDSIRSDDPIRNFRIVRTVNRPL